VYSTTQSQILAQMSIPAYLQKHAVNPQQSQESAVRFSPGS